jgi:hypothetical protein
VNYWKLFEIVLFIPPNTFWRVGKLHDFGKKFLGTLGDALTGNVLSQSDMLTWDACGLGPIRTQVIHGLELA